MKQPRKLSPKTQAKNGDTQVNIAKIGLISAIAVAVVGMIGTALSAYLSTQSVKAPILIPIQATQSAEASVALQAVPAKSTLLVPIQASPTTDSQPTPTSPQVSSTSTSTAPSTSTAEDRTTIFRIYTSRTTCIDPAVIPRNIDVEGDRVNALKQINQANDIDMWLHAPTESNLIYLSWSIVSLPENKEWIQLSNTIQTTIRARDKILEHINVLGECAGAGEYRVFSAIPLESRFDQYELTTSYQEADFFTLQPGEFEKFILRFQCTTPGVYSIHVNIPYTYLGKSGTIDLSPPDLVCPQSHTTWSVLVPPEMGIVRLDTYVWDGTDYVISP